MRATYNFLRPSFTAARALARAIETGEPGLYAVYKQKRPVLDTKSKAKREAKKAEAKR